MNIDRLKELLVQAESMLRSCQEHIQELKQLVIESEEESYKNTKELLIHLGFECYPVEVGVDTVEGVSGTTKSYLVTHRTEGTKAFNSRYKPHYLSLERTEHEAWNSACEQWIRELEDFREATGSDVNRVRWRGIPLTPYSSK